MKIRTAQLSDLDYIIDSLYKLRFYEKKLKSKLKVDNILTDGFKKHIEDEINSDNYLVLILEKNKNNIGILIGKVFEKNDVWDYKLFSNLNYLYIEEGFRKKGYGEKLSNEFLKWAKIKGSDRCLLDLVSNNINAKNLYEKMGFKEHVIILGKDL